MVTWLRYAQFSCIFRKPFVRSGNHNTHIFLLQLSSGENLHSFCCLGFMFLLFSTVSFRDCHFVRQINFELFIRKLCSGFFRNASVLGSTKSNFQLYNTCSPWTWSMAQCCLITQLQKSYKEGQSSVLQQFDWLAGRELCFFKQTLTN